VGFGLFEDVGEGAEGILCVEDCCVVESVAHDGRCDVRMWYEFGIVKNCVMRLIGPKTPKGKFS
jgi:hypothetical protein